MSYDNFYFNACQYMINKKIPRKLMPIYLKKEWELKIIIGINWSVNGITNA